MRVLVVGPSVPAMIANDSSLDVVHAPFIRLRPLVVPREKFLTPASGTIITSKHAVQFLEAVLPEPFYCVGSQSAKAVLKAFPGVLCITAATPTQEGLAALIIKSRPPSLLWPRSTHARRVLPKMLSQAGIDVIEIPLYSPVLCEQPCSLKGVDELFFTCPSAVDAFFRKFRPGDVSRMIIRSIGPVTAACVDGHIRKR